jgi:predicted transcriptional regulator
LRRSKATIIYEVLSVMVRNGGEASPSQISLEANLAYDRLLRLLEELEEKGLVVVESSSGRKWVRITSKGKELYHHLSHVKRILSDFGISL